MPWPAQTILYSPSSGHKYVNQLHRSGMNIFINYMNQFQHVSHSYRFHARGACLKDLPLVLAAIAVDGDCHVAVLSVLVLEAQPCAQGHLRL